ncbi:MAG: polysaccharide deacetylase family protein [Polyangiaceae bacterium]
MSRLKMRGFGLPAVVLAALYVACADPPKKLPPTDGSAGSSGVIGEAGASDGGDATSGSSGAGAPGGAGGSAGSTASAGKGGQTESGGEGPIVGEGGASGATSEAGAGGSAEPDACSTTTVGGKSSLPVPSTTGVVKPSGVPGTLKVVDWAGFKGALSFTFDDSLGSQINHYPELNAVGVPMTFYMVCANDSNKVFWTKVAHDGHEIGNHTMHHCFSYTAVGGSCDWGVSLGAGPELDVCTTHIEEQLGVKGVYSMASPQGDAGWGVPAESRFLVNRGISDTPGGVAPNDSTNAWNLPCHLANEAEKAVGGFNLITDSVRTNGSWRIILNHSVIAAGESNDGYHPVDPAEVVAAMTYAKGKLDVWVDTVTSIGAYWRAQKVVSTAALVQIGSDQVFSWTLPDNFPPGQYLRVTVAGGTVKQCGTPLTWDTHGYYEVALDAGALTISP